MATNRMGSRLDNLTEEQRAAVERIRARHRAPEYREQERQVRELVREDFPPAVPDADLSSLLAALKSERASGERSAFPRCTSGLGSTAPRSARSRTVTFPTPPGPPCPPTPGRWACASRPAWSRSPRRRSGIWSSAKIPRGHHACWCPLRIWNRSAIISDVAASHAANGHRLSPARPMVLIGSCWPWTPIPIGGESALLAHRWKLRARGRRDRDPVTPAFE